MSPKGFVSQVLWVLCHTCVCVFCLLGIYDSFWHIFGWYFASWSPSPCKWSDIATHGRNILHTKKYPTHGRNIDLHPVCKFLHAGAKMADLHMEANFYLPGAKNICLLIFCLPGTHVNFFSTSVQIMIWVCIFLHTWFYTPGLQVHCKPKTPVVLPYTRV